MAWVSASTKLDPKRLLFCNEYAAQGFRNASEAAEKVGIKPRSAASMACQWLKEADVAAYVAELVDARLYDAEIRSNDLIQELKAVAFGRVTDFAKIVTVTDDTEEGAKVLNREVVFTPFEDLPEHKLKALGEVGERRTKWGTQVYVKTHAGKLDAIRQLREIQAKVIPDPAGNLTSTVKSESTNFSLKRKHRRPPSDE
jgi:phage terminase small subunit